LPQQPLGQVRVEESEVTGLSELTFALRAGLGVRL
jgi:hypothetical protein